MEKPRKTTPKNPGTGFVFFANGNSGKIRDGAGWNETNAWKNVTIIVKKTADLFVKQEHLE